MFGLGTGELFMILVIVLVIFGAGKLPEIGGALGRGIRSFKHEMNGKDTEKQIEGQDKSKASEPKQ